MAQQPQRVAAVRDLSRTNTIVSTMALGAQQEVQKNLPGVVLAKPIDKQHDAK